MNQRRIAYILTCDVESERAHETAALLKRVGFTVQIESAVDVLDITEFEFVKNLSPTIYNKLIKNIVARSNKKSIYNIFDKARISEEDWVYIFEDDINAVSDITLSEIIQYEKISEHAFYLGCCQGPKKRFVEKTENVIEGYPVYELGRTFCAHAIAYRVASLDYIQYNMLKDVGEKQFYDCAFGHKFLNTHPCNIVRFTEVSPEDECHHGAFYQQRKKYDSGWSDKIVARENRSNNPNPGPTGLLIQMLEDEIDSLNERLSKLEEKINIIDK